ncbi:thioesterase [Streptomyces sp. HC44]|uniref:Thioesterase n=1 Tax=Streptomyces scabichelini TaxID=2711217 RepID=A0A6G4V1E2_9ACTN|nr:alpha/beta fold hydrolase [Streptomyces scabichelini]NGO07868.1 thioesterase [Streptomyces scabichelini]
MATRTWVRSLDARRVSPSRCRTLLVCCPHSGGWAQSFAPWREHVRDIDGDAELLAVQYPGHGDRGAERPEADVRAMADAISTELIALAPAEVLLFGHSFGAMVAYETTRQLESAGVPPAALAVSGARAPGDPAAPRGDADLPDEQLWWRVAELGGIDPLVAEEPDLRDLVLSGLRADITAHERYVSAPPAAPVNVGIRCYFGADDPLAPEDAGRGWAARTRGRVRTRVRPGGHFHLFESPHSLLADLLADQPGEPAGTEPESVAWA